MSKFLTTIIIMSIIVLTQSIFFGSQCGCPPATTPAPAPPSPPPQLCLPCIPSLQLPQIQLPQLCPCPPSTPSCGC